MQYVTPFNPHHSRSEADIRCGSLPVDGNFPYVFLQYFMQRVLKYNRPSPVGLRERLCYRRLDQLPRSVNTHTMT